jgi:hypothetical protein
MTEQHPLGSSVALSAVIVNCKPYHLGSQSASLFRHYVRVDYNDAWCLLQYHVIENSTVPKAIHTNLPCRTATCPLGNRSDVRNVPLQSTNPRLLDAMTLFHADMSLPAVLQHFDPSDQARCVKGSWAEQDMTAGSNHSDLGQCILQQQGLNCVQGTQAHSTTVLV